VDTTTGQLTSTGVGGDFLANVSMSVLYGAAIDVIDVEFVIDLNSSLDGTSTATRNSQRQTLEQSVVTIFIEVVSLVQKFSVTPGDTLDIFARNRSNSDLVTLFDCTFMVTAI
jgi:hypothetical protein